MKKTTRSGFEDTVSRLRKLSRDVENIAQWEDPYGSTPYGNRLSDREAVAVFEDLRNLVGSEILTMAFPNITNADPMNRGKLLATIDLARIMFETGTQELVDDLAAHERLKEARNPYHIPQ